MADNYIPPEGDQLKLTFSGGYVIPDGDKLVLDFAKQGGGPAVDSYIFPIGYNSNLFGHITALQQQFIRPLGFVDIKWGLPKLHNLRHIASPFGIYQFEMPNPNIITKNRYVRPSGSVFTLFGQTDVRNYRTVVTGVGFVATVWGNNVVWNRNYQVDNATLGDQLIVGNNRIYNSIQKVVCTGFDSLIFAYPNVRNKTPEVRVAGQVHTEFGLHSLTNVRSQILPPSFGETVWGRPFVENHTREVREPYPWYYPNTGGVGEPFVRGGKKTIYVGEGPNELWGEHAIRLATFNQEIIPEGWLSFAIGDIVMSPRTLIAKSVTSGWFGTPSLFRPIAYPFGIKSNLALGVPRVYENPWYVHTPSIGDNLKIGQAKVRDALYQVYAHSDLNVNDTFGVPYVYNHTRYIYPEGYKPYDIFEWNVVYNSKKLVHLKGWESEKWGRPSFIGTPELVFKGFDSLVFGHTDVSAGNRTVHQKGHESSVIGQPTVIGTPTLYPRGIGQGDVGFPTTMNWSREVNVISAGDTSLFGTQTIWLKRRWLEPSGFQVAEFGTQFVSHFLRWLEPLSVSPYNHFGTDWVSLAKRHLNPTSIFTEFPSNHIVGGTQFIHVYEGIYGTAFGTRIIPERQTVHPKGMTGAHGLHDVMLRTQYVKPRAFEAGGNHDFFGTQHVWNSRQYVHQYFIGESGLVPPQWSSWTHIWNRNKTIGALGTRFDKFGYHQIYNNARLLEPKGIEGSTPNAFLVAYRIRDVLPDSINEPYFGTWNHVWNNARVISVTGIKPANAYGLATVKNTRRYYPYITLGEQVEWGLPMVAYRVRNIEIERRYSIAPPLIPLPEVKQWRRYVEPLGREHLGTGVPELRIHWNIIKPRWTHKDLFGDVGLRNVTPEVHAKPLFSEEFGRQTVFNSKQFVTQTDPSSTLYGRQRVEFRTKVVGPVAFHSLQIGNHKVIKGATPPYGLQHIVLEKKNDLGEIVDGFGIEPPIYQVGFPLFNINVLRPYGIYSFKMGDDHRVQNNTIQIVYGIYDDMIGDVVVQNRRRYLDLDDGGIRPRLELGKPRLSPHTIYAPTGAPEQAQINHPTPNGPTPISTGIVVGSPMVLNRHRKIYQYGSSQTMVGTPAIGLYKQYIRPNGIKSFRIGAVNVGDGRQFVRQFASTDFMVFGWPKLNYPIDNRNFVKVGGFDSQQFGTHWVSGWIRNVYPKMWLSQAMGESRESEYEYMPQSLHVGPKMPTIPEGFNAEVFGKHWISLRVRDIQMDGFDAFSMDYDYTAFTKRMRVTRKDVLKPHSRLFVAGIEATLFGTTDIKLGARYIRPDGNSDQFRKGVLHE